MCATCGCAGEHEFEHRKTNGHSHVHGEAAATRTLRLQRDILERNAAHARDNRAWLARRAVAAIDLVSSPGSGKTSLIEATIRAAGGKLALSVIEGDQETERDAARVRAAGARAVQINTGTGCHLDAHAVGHALDELDPVPESIVLIENVGNLVCPALFDLGEHAKVVVLSVTEGDDKPLKYPHMFRSASLLVLNKIDLLRHVRFDVDGCLERARRVNPKLRALALSAATGEGVELWCAWLLARLEAARASPRAARDGEAAAS